MLVKGATYQHHLSSISLNIIEAWTLFQCLAVRLIANWFRVAISSDVSTWLRVVVYGLAKSKTTLYTINQSVCWVAKKYYMSGGRIEAPAMTYKGYLFSLGILMKSLSILVQFIFHTNVLYTVVIPVCYVIVIFHLLQNYPVSGGGGGGGGGVSWNALSQWEKALLCNASSHWPSPYPGFSRNDVMLTSQHVTQYQPLHPLTHLPPGQNGRHFADDIFRCIFVNEMFLFWLKFHWSLFLWVQLTITQH